MRDLMCTWEADLRMISYSHYSAAVKCAHRNQQLGVAVVIVSAVVGSAILGTLAQNPAAWMRIIAGLLSMVAAVLASLQTFLKFSERAQMHREAGARFGSLVKELEQYLRYPIEDPASFKEWCEEFRGRWDQRSISAPTVPEDVWQRQVALRKQRDESLID